MHHNLQYDLVERVYEVVLRSRYKEGWFGMVGAAESNMMAGSCQGLREGRTGRRSARAEVETMRREDRDARLRWHGRSLVPVSRACGRKFKVLTGQYFH